MKQLAQRIQKLEDMLEGDTSVPMVCMKDIDGFHWNGATYPDHASLTRALNSIAKNSGRGPLVIINSMQDENSPRGIRS